MQKRMKMKKVPAYFFIGLATVLFGYAMPAQHVDAPAQEAVEASVEAVFVNISALSAEYTNKAIEVKWEADTELDNKQFEVQRSVDGKEFKTVGLVFTVGDDGSPLKYAFRDNLKGVTTKKLFYRIKQTSVNNEHHYSDIVTTALQKKKV